MYKLTDRRLEVAEQILEKYRSHLIEGHRFSAPSLEHELRAVWTNVGYQEIKGIMIDMFKNHERFKYVAAFYMENSNATGVVSEFKSTLAKAYGVRSFHSSDAEKGKEEFWETAREELGKN